MYFVSGVVKNCFCFVYVYIDWKRGINIMLVIII